MLSPDHLYSSIVSAVNKTPFLRIIEGDQAARILHVVSDRKEDPRGIIEITIFKAPYGSRFYFRIEDEESLSLVNEKGGVARYGVGFKHEDTISGLLLKDAREEAQ